ncbi:class I SAM-dependent methyltransferase [candidate division KSB1 bacterium]|nr:class I SAM-dependent methyltransferase [candidate division KSB1 bacterium]MBL7092957.1 class I SAM-dependent methyltransferase [candidate division KSB1 bacterium]
MNKLLWNLKTRYYKLFRSFYPFQRILNKENSNLVTLINQVELKGKSVLDLGVGTGNVLEYLNGAKSIIGLDFTYSMLLEARESYPNLPFIQADALSIPVKTKSMDMITAVGLIEYIKDIIPFFEETCRILKNGGCLVLTFSPANFWTRMRLLLGHPIYVRTSDQLKGVIQQYNFQIIDYQQSMMQHQVLLQKSVE